MDPSSAFSRLMSLDLLDQPNLCHTKAFVDQIKSAPIKQRFKIFTAQPPDERNRCLKEAAFYGQPDVFDVFVSDQSDVLPSLIAAAGQGHTDMVCHILSSSTLRPSDVSRALAWSCLNGHVSCVKVLLPHADPNAHNGEAMVWAAKTNHPDIVDMMASAVTMNTANGKILYYAALNGNQQLVDKFLPLTNPGEHITTALTSAAQGGNASCWEAIYEALIKSDQLILDQTLQQCFTLAANNNHIELASRLMMFSSSSSRSHALDDAVSKDQLDVINLVLPHTERPSEIRAPMLRAATLGKIDCVRLLSPKYNCSSYKAEAARAALNNNETATADYLMGSWPKDMDLVPIHAAAVEDRQIAARRALLAMIQSKHLKESLKSVTQLKSIPPKPRAF